MKTQPKSHTYRLVSLLTTMLTLAGLLALSGCMLMENPAIPAKKVEPKKKSAVQEVELSDDSVFYRYESETQARGIVSPMAIEATERGCRIRANADGTYSYLMKFTDGHKAIELNVDGIPYEPGEIPVGGVTMNLDYLSDSWSFVFGFDESGNNYRSVTTESQPEANSVCAIRIDDDVEPDKDNPNRLRGSFTCQNLVRQQDLELLMEDRQTVLEGQFDCNVTWKYF